MDANVYSTGDLIRDLRSICTGERREWEVMTAVKPLARRMASAPGSWLTDRMRRVDPEQGFGVTLLHEEPDHTLAVLVVSWEASRGAPPHDHGTWAVISGVEGEEYNEFFKRSAAPGAGGEPATIQRIGGKACGAGDVLALPSGAIHSVENRTDRLAISLHIYGKNINYTGRSQFDPATGVEKPFLLAMEE